MSEGKPTLTGIRVIDCGTYIAGPCAATVMSDFGAEVIKIERPPHGDPYRYLSLVPGMPVSNQQYCWILDARNKKSLALDLAHEAGRGVLLKLVSSADVFVTNYQPQLVAKFRLHYEALRAINPRLIYAGVTGYGESGDEAEKPGYDSTAYWARSGLMGIMHNADAEPCQSPAGFGDHPTGMALFGAIMLALYQRERTGEGMKVSTSLMANGAWSNSCTIQAKFIKAEWPVRRTRRHPNNPLVNHYLAKDGHRFMLCLLEPLKDWPKLCDALGRPALTGEDSFNTPQARRANAAALVALLDAGFATRDMAEWAELFRAHDVLWGPVSTMDQVGDDPQMEANGVFPEIADAPGGPLRTVSNPITVDGIEKTPPRMAPEIGQHSVEILESLGYSAEAIRELREKRVVQQSVVP